MSRLFKSKEEIEQVVRGFETCATPATDFHHREHLTVAVWYLETLDYCTALDRMRAGLLRFLDQHGVDKKKYSEEITIYWMKKVEAKMKKGGKDVPLVQKCNEVISCFNSQARKPAFPVEAEE